MPVLIARMNRDIVEIFTHRSVHTPDHLRKSDASGIACNNIVGTGIGLSAVPEFIPASRRGKYHLHHSQYYSASILLLFHKHSYTVVKTSSRQPLVNVLEFFSLDSRHYPELDPPPPNFEIG